VRRRFNLDVRRNDTAMIDELFVLNRRLHSAKAEGRCPEPDLNLDHFWKCQHLGRALLGGPLLQLKSAI